MHQQDRGQDRVHIPDIRAALSFDADSYLEKLIDVCVSHNEDAHVLMDRDPTNFDQWRFPTQYPIGCCIADVRFVAAVLRIADILDFDRERTPPVLYYYLLPRSADPSENVSVREWSKHLSISNWEIEAEKVVFRGRSPNALIHHAIVEFCHTIEGEISRTRGIFADEEWPICVKPNVEAVIETSGYRYIPYRFSLDEERIYELLMGRNIYERPLDALRELVQNAVDACLLRDAHALLRRFDCSK
jgi:molecular chaperone HtpG